MQLKVICLYVLIGLIIPDAAAQDLKLAGSLDIEFDSGDMHDMFKANEDYLVWVNYTYQELWYHHLKTGRTQKKTLTQGRGPSEFLQVSGVALDDENRVYLADYPNSKVIVWDIETELFEDDISLTNPPFRILVNDGILYNFNFTNINQPVSILALPDGEEMTVTLEGAFFSEFEGMEHLFSREGSLIFDEESGSLVHLSRYRNVLTKFTIKENEVGVESYPVDQMQELEYQERELADGSVNSSLDPNSMLLAQSAVKQRASGSSYYILFNDNRNDSVYSARAIYHYSTMEPEVHPENDIAIQIDFKIDRLAFNAQYIFAFSADEGKVYRLEYGN